MRFAVDGDGGPWALAVHRESGEGLGDLEIHAASRWQRSDGEVLFKAKEGVRYEISLGVRADGQGGEFTLRWEDVDDPGWLRYVGQLADGARDSRGNPVEIRDPGDLAMNADGTALYMASAIGLQVFERDPATAGLDQIQLLETDFDLARAALLWDPHRDRLVADNCDAWRSFAPGGAAGLELEDLGDLSASDDPRSCHQGDHTLLMDGDGSDIYRVAPHQSTLSHFAVDDGGGLRFVGAESSVRMAVLSDDGEHLYGANLGQLLVFTRDAETGELSRTDFEEVIDVWWCCVPGAMAITDDDAHLFVFDQHGERANLFSLEDPLNPDRLATLSQFWEPPREGGNWFNQCRFVDVRPGAVAVDAFCPSLAFAVRWNADALRLAGTDWISAWQSDRFNSPSIPEFRTAPRGFAVSPDDRHIYLSTPQHGIVIIGRDSPPGEDRDGPDLVVGSPSVDDRQPGPGATFMLNATVRNLGNVESVATTLRFYRSADDSISGGDTEVGSAHVPGVAASGASDHSITLTAPSDPGTYRYGACVDGVADESDAGNNCSTAVAVRVTGSGDSGEPDLVVESPAVSDDEPAPGATFTLSVVVQNGGEGDSEATTLRYYRSTNSTISARDTEVGTDAVDRVAAGGSSDESIDLSAPDDPGTYYYGACVDSVSGESRTDNNCSSGVKVEVADGGGGSDSYCRDDQSVEPGRRCDIFDTSFWFEVRTSGRGCLRAGGISICGGNSIRQNGSLNGVRVTLLADRGDDDSWTIDDVEPEPD